MVAFLGAVGHSISSWATSVPPNMPLNAAKSFSVTFVCGYLLIGGTVHGALLAGKVAVTATLICDLLSPLFLVAMRGRTHARSLERAFQVSLVITAAKVIHRCLRNPVSYEIIANTIAIFVIHFLFKTEADDLRQSHPIFYILGFPFTSA
jgi:hypothetical protein